MDPATPTALYRLFTVDHRLLYLGIAEDPDARWLGHAATAPWWPLIVHKTVEWFTDRTAALDAERIAVQNERPIFNVQHKIKGKPGSANPTHTTVRNFRVPDETFLPAKARAEAEGVTLTSVLIDALIAYVEENRHLLATE